MSNDPDLDSAYALKTPEDSVRLYRDWAQSYDADFADASGYVLHEEVARHYVTMGGFGPVLDVGAGTGLCGIALRARGIEPVDGTDISPEMLSVAKGKAAYRHLFPGNLLDGLTLPDGPYQGLVSSGTFTHGHVGPGGIDPVMDAVRPGGWIVLSVNAAHHQAAGFADRVAQLDGEITDVSQTEVAIYGPDAQGPHAQDTALLLAFRKA
ncbi:class I SAM-dependent DNA methyltransferase [Tateyamaria sp. SN3-11]|uniref:class I SAM-dependent DNA methyltransferase n=1 Tax=Tateyamaria sp. SN3-11 TaxID=3092147 RepID=UPI0039E88CAF